MTVATNLDEQAYVKQIRTLDPSYLPLYNPNPWARDDVYIGDVGVIQTGTFRPLFNITMGVNHARNGGDVPENFEPIQFSSSSDVYTRSDPTIIKKFEPCVGDPRLVWVRHVDPVDESEADEEGHPSFCYKFTKTTPEPSYALLAMADVEETAVEERQMEAWRHYMENNHKYWLKYVRKKWLDPKFEAGGIILLCGFIKTSRWIIATLPKEGEYWLDVQDTPVGIQPTLRLGERILDKGLRYGQDMVEEDRQRMQRLAQMMGIRVAENPRPIRKRCLFITGLRMEKDFWAPKRIVAAAEPQDPRSLDGEHHLEPLLSAHSLHDRGEADHEESRRCGLESASRGSYDVQSPAPYSQIHMASLSTSHFDHVPHEYAAHPARPSLVFSAKPLTAF